MAYLAGTVHPTYSRFFRPERFVPEGAPVDAVKAKGGEQYWDCLVEIDGLLAGKKWAMGKQFTVVDPYLLVMYRWANRNAMPVTKLAHYTALIQRVLARPAVKKVMADEGITMS